MDPQVREIIQRWRDRYHKAFFSVEQRTSFWAPEDAHVTKINLLTQATASAQAAGEFAGLTQLSPTAEIPLPVGMVAVVEEFFCGVPCLTLYQGSPPQVAEAR